ncbi:MAG TPA: formate dehydrogenase subunit gamma [Azospirillum sp.]|nr:formate dehydrogenase subunit gamma [Azospirillum sp.]
MTSWCKAALAALMLTLGFAAADLPARAADTAPAATQQLNTAADADVWRAIRQGVQGTSSLPNPRAGVLIQSEGESWRALRNGPIATYGAWALAGILVVLVLFFLFRGRIRLDAPATGRTVQRFNALERGTHWLTAGSFIVLALTGLNVLYGRWVLLPVIGPEAFAALTGWGKLAHNYLGFAFMAGVLVTFLLWVRHNIPERADLTWFAQAGGLFSKNVHPAAKKFNAGQKVIFWSTVLGGAGLGFTGLALLFPFSFGGLQDMQLYQMIHAVIALAMAVIIIGHIYIGSIGMEGAFDAMGSGQVEEEWAREHHALWLAEVKGERIDQRPRGGRHGHHAPAE